MLNASIEFLLIIYPLTPTGKGKPSERKPYFDLLDLHMAGDVRIEGVTKMDLELGVERSADIPNPSGDILNPSTADSQSSSSTSLYPSLPSPAGPLYPILESIKSIEILPSRAATSSSLSLHEMKSAKAEISAKKRKLEENIEALEKEIAKLDKEMAKLDLEIEVLGMKKEQYKIRSNVGFYGEGL